jgi:rhodanese-related sulfurtransferase
VRRLSAPQLAEYLERRSPRLIDVREPWEFDICHIEDSELVPMRQIPDRLDLFQESPEYVIICHHGIRSMQVIRFLAMQGIEHTINLDGGVDAWARQVDLNMPVY